MNQDPDKRKNKEVKLSWFIEELKKYKFLYFELIVIALIIRLFYIIEPFIFQVLIDRILPFQKEASLLVLVIVFLCASLFQSLFSALSSFLGIITSNKVTQAFGSKIFTHLFKLPLGFSRKWHVGETISRLSETDTIRNFLVGVSTGSLLDLVFVFVYFFILLSLSPSLTLVVLVMLPLHFIIYFAFGPFLRNRLKEQFDAGAQHQSQIVENISGMISVKAIGAEPILLERLNSTLSNVLDTHYKVGIISISSGTLTFIVERCTTIAIIYFGAQLVFGGALTLGELIAFHLLAERVIEPLANFSQLWESWQNIRVSRNRLGDIVNTTVEPFGLLPKLDDKLANDLEFSTANFGYSDDTLVLENFNFKAIPNSLSIIVGPSGSGKSTFGRLASGIEKLSKGVVKFGGENIEEYDPVSVRSTIAYIPQEPYLFSGTIRENLLIGRNSVSQECINHALRVASAESLVDDLPHGLDTQVGERGSALSGGQKQRVAIARSILSKPRVLILDEPTSALDEASQNKMAIELAKLKQTTTIILITHQPKLFSEVDQIMDFGELK